MCITHFCDLNYFHCEFKSEECARKWVSDYKEKTKETMVYDSCKNLSGKKWLRNGVPLLPTQTKADWIAYKEN